MTGVFAIAKKLCLYLMIFVMAVTSVPLLTPEPVSAYSVSGGPLFNNPYGKTSSQRKILDQVKNAIRNTPKNSVIRIATYSIRDQAIYDAIKYAKAKGAIIQIVIDDHSYHQDDNDDTLNEKEREDSKMLEALKVLLKTNTRDLTKSFIKICSRGCMSNSPYTTQHAKYYMFSRTGDSKLVSMVSSSNLSPGHTRAWNDMYRVVGSEKLYNELKAYFYEMVKEDDDKVNYHYQNIAISSRMRLYTFPRNVDSNDDDVHYTMLEKVKCTGMASGYGYNGKTVLHYAMFKWLDTRDDVARKLRSLADQGCIVKVLTSQKNIGPGVVRELLAPKNGKASTVQIKGADYRKSATVDYYMHSKYIDINGYYNDPELTSSQRARAKIVFTGSPNLTSTGIGSNSEVMLRIRNDSSFDAYAKNFSVMWNNSHSKPIRYVDPN